MIPAFDDWGNLPPGIHPATVDEIASRFGVGSAERRVEFHELNEFVAWARRSGVTRIIINGSFVTGATQPGDVDIVILPGAGYPGGEMSATKMLEIVGHSSTSRLRPTMAMFKTGAIGILAQINPAAPKVLWR